MNGEIIFVTGWILTAVSVIAFAVGKAVLIVKKRRLIRELSSDLTNL